MLICTVDPYILTPDSPRLITCPVSFKKATQFNFLNELYQFYLRVNIVHIRELSFFCPPFVYPWVFSEAEFVTTHVLYAHIYSSTSLILIHCYLFIFSATFPKFTLKLSLSLEIRCVTFEDYIVLLTVVPAEVDGLSFVQ